MIPDTRRSIHLGVNFIVTPAPAVDARHIFQFQQRLAEEQIEFNQTNRSGHIAVFVRQQPSVLQVQVGPLAPGAPVGQLMMLSSMDVAQSPATAVISQQIFGVAADAIGLVFREVWPETQQVVARDAAVRGLIDSGQEHAFRYLWEQRFKQPEEHLAVFGRTVVGGGLRLVFGPRDREEPQQVEVRLESFLADPRQLYVEAVARWPMPIPPSQMDPQTMLRQTSDIIGNELLKFINEMD